MRDRTEEIFGTVLATYTRRMAIEDGHLVDLMQRETEPLVVQAGFKWPVAMTTGAWLKTVGGLDGERLPEGQDIKGRLWDVLNLAKVAISNSGDPTRVNFKVSVFDGRAHKIEWLWVTAGAGDNHEPVITIMLVGED